MLFYLFYFLVYGGQQKACGQMDYLVPEWARRVHDHGQTPNAPGLLALLFTQKY